MKLFKYLLSATILIFSLVSCGSDDADPVNQVEEDMGWVTFTINGEIMNGEYRIDANPDFPDNLAMAVLTQHQTLPNEHNAWVAFHDINQNIQTQLVFYANEANFEFDFFSIASGIPGYGLFEPANPMSINITQLETLNVVYSPEPLITKIAATFSGTVVTHNLDNGDEFYHSIQGEFYIQVQVDND